jgi:tRNA-Thr(GGU) m(6)t(6)A37 methyltransferase TsaA
MGLDDMSEQRNVPEKKPRGNDAVMKVIARIHTDLPTKFGVPRQSGLVEALKAVIIFEPGYRSPEAVRGLEEFSHIWLLWQFSETVRETWSPTVRPPRLGGDKRMGVFATRSPFRPNALGLSCVRLDSIALDPDFGPVLHVSGADLMDRTPIFDIKPYLPYTDCRPEASGGFTDTHKFEKLEVNFPDDLLQQIPEHQRAALIGILTQDPRPSYIEDPDRLFGFEFGSFDVKFTVQGNVLTVNKLEPLNKKKE